MYAVEMRGISKAFGGVHALKGVDLLVEKGRVHALLGENGAGKSTLMKILCGVIRYDSGQVLLEGKPVKLSSPKEAIENGISMIFQELNVVPQMNVTDNVYLGRELTGKNGITINRKAMKDNTRRLIAEIGLELDPAEIVGTLSVAKIQLVEIAKAISYGSRLVIMDEPTSALSEIEIAKLFEIIERLKSNGVTVIFITHKLEEIYSICDNVTILRDGSNVFTSLVESTNENQLISMMVGRDVGELFPKEKSQKREMILRIVNLSYKNKVRDVSLDIYKGEILGIAGLMGSGRTELAETIFGLRKKTSGELILNGKKLRISSPRDAVKNNIALVPEDRKTTGLFLRLPVRDNIVISSLHRCAKMMFIRKRNENSLVREMIAKLRIKLSNTLQPCSSLSGGNQQKVVIAKWLLTDPDVIILDEPTRGIDVKTKAEVHMLISKLAAEGKAVVMISSELPELLGTSDRIVVLHEGAIVADLDSVGVSQEELLRRAIGQR